MLRSLLSNHLVFNRLLQQPCIRNVHLLKDKAYVDGKWITSVKQFDVVNPGTGEIVGSVPDLTVDDTKKAIEAAAEAFKTWQSTTPKERSAILRNWFNHLEKHKEDLAQLMTSESGKPLVESRGEVAYGNSFIEWFSEEARKIQGEIIASPLPNKRMFVEKFPIGVVALITPWNFPLAMITRKAGAALAAGCTCIVKPSEDTPLTALALAQLADDAGLPKGIFNVITTDRQIAAEIAKTICESPLVAGISLTGSTAVGKIYYKLCSSGVKRISLELGGNAPFIVFKSANIDKAVKGAMASKFRNCGQTCVASNRFLVDANVHDHFVKELASAMKNLNVGVGTKSDVNIGPLINKRQFDSISKLVDDAVSLGAKVVTGAKPAKEHGELFYQPTLLTGITEKMRVYHEEIFGPVIPIIRFETEEEAVKIANGTEYGLAGYFYSEDINQIFRVSKLLEFGMLGINEGIISSAEAPFGGIKQSGLGREGGHLGIEEYVYNKYICYGIH